MGLNLIHRISSKGPVSCACRPENFRLWAPQITFSLFSLHFKEPLEPVQQSNNVQHTRQVAGLPASRPIGESGAPPRFPPWPPFSNSLLQISGRAEIRVSPAWHREGHPNEPMILHSDCRTQRTLRKRSALSKRTRTLGHYHTEPY